MMMTPSIMNANCLNKKLSVLLLYLYASEPVLLYTTNKLTNVRMMTMAHITLSPLVLLTKLPPMLLMLGVKNSFKFIFSAIVFYLTPQPLSGGEGSWLMLYCYFFLYCFILLVNRRQGLQPLAGLGTLQIFYCLFKLIASVFVIFK